MPTFGDWISEPDVERWTNLLGPDGLVAGEGEASDQAVTELDPRVITEGDLQLVVQEAYQQNGTVGDGLGMGDVSYFWTYDLSYPQWTSTWLAEVNKGRRQIAPPAGGVWFTESGPDPEDAIGVQYEGREWNPDDPWSYDVEVYATDITGCWIRSSTVLESNVADESNVGERDLSGTFTTQLVFDLDGPTSSTALLAVREGGPESGTFTQPLGEDIDLTDLLEPQGWVGTMHLRTDYLGPFRPPDMEPLESSHGRIRFGWGIRELRLKWFYTAPRYRWVYGTTPYRRTSHRHDSLAGGATRNYPPSRALQSSNRIGGGYL